MSQADQLDFFVPQRPALPAETAVSGISARAAATRAVRHVTVIPTSTRDHEAGAGRAVTVERTSSERSGSTDAPKRRSARHVGKTVTKPARSGDHRPRGADLPPRALRGPRPGRACVRPAAAASSAEWSFGGDDLYFEAVEACDCGHRIVRRWRRPDTCDHGVLTRLVPCAQCAAPKEERCSET